ncbi:hypothetical protein ACFLSQ_04500 [Bacteroidota bacterium]
MNKILLTFAVVFLTFILVSCEDIIDIGEVTKKPIFPHQDPVSTIVTPDSVFWNFREHYVNQGREDQYYWATNVRYIRNVIEIDTASVDPVISFDIEVESIAPDDAMPFRSDRITSFKMTLDTLKLTDNVLGEMYNRKSNWAGIYIKTIADQKTYYYMNNDLKFTLLLYPMQPDMLLGQIFVEIKENSFETIMFEGVIEIYYPYKKNL